MRMILPIAFAVAVFQLPGGETLRGDEPVARLNSDGSSADVAQDGDGSSESGSTEDAAARSEKNPELFRGKVVLLRDALKRRGIASKSEFDGQVVLETIEEELIPIVPDWRGRAFYQDERLRDRKVDLLGFRKPGQPYLQVISIYTFDKQGVRQYTDYWCDICAIPMYEIKPCDCCQQEIRIRFQPRTLPDYLRSSEAPAGERPAASEEPAPDSDDEPTNPDRRRSPAPVETAP